MDDEHVPVQTMGTRSNIWKRIIVKLLSRLENAHVTLVENEQTLMFGSVDDVNDLKATVVIHDPKVYRLVVTGASVGLAEGYIQGMWSCDDLVVLLRILGAYISSFNKPRRLKGLILRMTGLLSRWFNYNTIRKSRLNIQAHYDLATDFFKTYLDEHMQYSCVMFPNDDASLDEAALHKLQIISDRLAIKPGEKILEIGSGWGGLALYLAKHHDCHVTTTTISDVQFNYVLKRISEEGLHDRVKVVKLDYRELHGTFDKCVSIEMIEAIGFDQFALFFDKCRSLLKEGGELFLQAIVIEDRRFEAYKHQIDFIRRYIFPGGCLPSVSQLVKHTCGRGGWQLLAMDDFGLDYAKTLSHWRQRFNANLDKIRHMKFSEEFIRMWRYYFCYCEAGFREHWISSVQCHWLKMR